MSVRFSAVTETVEILSISAREWRVRDRAKAASDPTSLLGFIAGIGEVFEVTMIGHPYERTYLATFDQALAYLTADRLRLTETAA